ncbi:MAG: PorP/SprF family type IX secretion system membrane protein, partial [Bacteroidota bacterium]
MGLLLILLSFSGKAQDLLFSQTEISPNLSNPALYNQGSQMEFLFAYRQQNLEFGENFNSPLFFFKYPIFNSQGQHQGSFLLSFLRDNQLDILRVTGLSLGYAHQINLRRGRLSFGMQSGYFQKSLNLDDLSTRSQFDFLTGFDPGLPNNEPNGRFNAYFANLSTGIYWELRDRYQRPRFYLGGALNNFNQPNASFT